MCASLVLAMVLAVATRPARADERVDVTAMDGTQLVGELGGSSGPGVVLVHGARADRTRWAALAAALASEGFRTLRVDLRGHGASSGAVDLAAADRDVEGAYRYLLGRKIRPVFVVGEGVGGGAALVVATRVPVAGLAVLGPLAPGSGSSRPAAAPSERPPVLFLVGDGDRETAALAATVATSRVVVISEPDLVTSPRTLPALLALLRGEPSTDPTP